jgi:hypothetical protein
MAGGVERPEPAGGLALVVEPASGRRPAWAGPGGLEGPRHTRRDQRRFADRHGRHHRGPRPASASATASATSSSCTGPTASRWRTSSRTSAVSPCPGRERPRAHHAVRSGAAARPARPAPIRVRRRVGMTRLRIRGGTQPRGHLLAHLGGCATAPGRGRVPAQIRKRGAARRRNTARPRRLCHGLTCPRRGAAQWSRNRPRAAGPPPRRPASP